MSSMRAGRRAMALALAVALDVAAVAVSAAAAPPAGTPAPRTVVLTAADFPGKAHDVSTRSISANGKLLAGFENTLAFTGPYGASRYMKLQSEALVETDAAAAKVAYAGLISRYSSPGLRSALVRQVFAGATVSRVLFIKPHPLGVLPVSTELGIAASASGRTANFSISLLRVDRVVVQNIASGRGTRVVTGDARGMMLKAAVKASRALVPANLMLPEVIGSAQQGKTLTATRGTWAGSPTSYGFQWQDCDPSGTPCNDIPGATSSSYVVRASDVGSTLRVHVTARNAFGFRFVASQATSVVF
jgi:hypothetical protein